MADSATLIFPRLNAKIDSLTVDVSMSEGHSHKVQVTDHPVERGANISDHARPLPITVKLEGIVTDTPIDPAQDRRAAAQLGVQVPTAPRTYFGPAEAAHFYLATLAAVPRLITLVTRLAVYEDMIMTDLDFPVDKSTGDACHFSATFKHVSLVDNAVVKVAVSPSESRARSPSDLGTKPTQDVTGGADDHKSWLWKISDNTGGWADKLIAINPPTP